MDLSKYFPSGILIGQPLSLSDCRVLRPYLLERAGIQNGSVQMIAVPYAVPCESRTVSNGDRIAQLVITPVLTTVFTEVDELTDTARAAGGFGSTGTK